MIEDGLERDVGVQAVAPVGLSRSQLMVSTFAIEGTFAAIALAVGWYGAWPWYESAVSLQGLLAGLVVGLALAAVVIAITHSSTSALAALRENFDRLLDAFAPLRARDLLLMSLMAGVGEEALFRGLLQTALQPSLGTGAALVGVSLAFGLFHCVSVSYVVYTFVLGLLWGGLALYTGELLAAVVAHAVFDAVALLYGALVLRPRRLQT